MIGEWVAQNPGEAIGVASSACVLIGWLLVKWLGDKFEPKRPELSEKQKAEEMERLARSVLSTPVIREFAESSIVTEEQSARFFETVENIVTRSMAVRDCMREQAKHVFASHESAMRVLISDAVRGVGADLQKSMTDSQSMFMTELRGIRESLTEKVDAFREEVAEMRTELAVHKASDEAKKPG